MYWAIIVISTKLTIQTVQDENGGVVDLSNPAKIPRDRMQVYNASRNVDKPKSRNTDKVENCDFSKLQLMLNTGNFVRTVTYARNNQGTVSPRVFAATETSMGLISKFCEPNPKS